MTAGAKTTNGQATSVKSLAERYGAEVQSDADLAAIGGERLTISAPNFRLLRLQIIGTAPFLQNAFSEKALRKLMDTMQAGSTSKKGGPRDKRDFEADYLAARHISEEGWSGVPASSFRNASVDACRAAGFQMTHARMAIFVKPDGIDKLDGQPLVRINGDYERSIMAVRNASGVVDLRARPLWRKWDIDLVVDFDADMFSALDVVNLLNRAGRQVGIGEGRPFSKKSNGMGFGTFRIGQHAEVAEEQE